MSRILTDVAYLDIHFVTDFLRPHLEIQGVLYSEVVIPIPGDYLEIPRRTPQLLEIPVPVCLAIRTLKIILVRVCSETILQVLLGVFLEIKLPQLLAILAVLLVIITSLEVFSETTNPLAYSETQTPGMVTKS